MNSTSLQELKLRVSSQLTNLSNSNISKRFFAAGLVGISFFALSALVPNLGDFIEKEVRTSTSRISQFLESYNFGSEKEKVAVTNRFQIQSLVMEGGNPHIRALMRTISASEAYDDNPYNIIYGGQHISDLSRHPEICVTIPVGPNRGNCSTAAGRYQFLNITWSALAEDYHPAPQTFPNWGSYSFEPEYQDIVLYKWLSDPNAWGVNIAQSLESGNVNGVLQMLSPTWTSLGYGIETNSMSGNLPSIYQEILAEEMRIADIRG